MTLNQINYSVVRSCLLQRVPTTDFFNPSLLSSELVTLETQEKIHGVLQAISEVNAYYVKVFLKRYISFIEYKNEEVFEPIYELYCAEEILSAVENDPTTADILKYWVGGFDALLNDEPAVAIKEQPKLISGSGTTGGRTWEAALYLSNYLNEATCPIDLKGKLVCELGTGTGLVSLALTKNPAHQLKQIIMTDGNATLIENLKDSFKLNGINDMNNIQTCQLLWGTTNPEDPENFIQSCPEVDLVLAADVTYDSRILDVLCSTIHDFFDAGSSMAIIAATVRKKSTDDDWEAELNKWFSQWSIIDICQTPNDISGNCWFKKGTPPIKVYQILK